MNAKRAFATLIFKIAGREMMVLWENTSKRRRSKNRYGENERMSQTWLVRRKIVRLGSFSLDPLLERKAP
jgi:hypothetical protein